MKTIAFIETASAQGLRNLATARALGYRTIFVSENPGQYRPSPSAGGDDPLAQADEIVIASSTFSAQSIAEAIGERALDGVIAFGDYHLIPAAEYARSRGLPHCDIAALERGRRKDLMRAWLREAGVPMPRFAVVDDADAAPTSPIGYPCIVKPADDNGSVGIHRADDDAGFRRAVAAVLATGMSKRGFRLAGKALVEEFLLGVEMSAEAVWTPDGWAILGLSARRNAGPIGATEISLTFPADVSADASAEIHRAVHAWLDASGLNVGGAHVEFRLGAHGPQLLEINPRLAGSGLTELVRIASDFDPVAYVIAQAVGDAYPLPACPLAPARAATLEFLHSERQGTLRAVHGLDTVRSMPSVMAADITADLPREVAPILTNYDFLGYVLAVAANPNESLKHARSAIGEFRLDID
ncbi:ATP-grasp domain-containing protein [Lysobacter sp. CA199]|uniref:ATP-grasp domain-containing protein n=1 Tax=Lysobacter sp. CA199 TaxID=3455608 RepID=UPI003F8CFA56